MQVELLYFEDCPHWKVAQQRLKELGPEVGFTVIEHVVSSQEEADAFEMRGSPTVLIDGRDPFLRGDEPPSLSCRIYDTPQGPAGAPTVQQLRAALNSLS